VEVSGWHQAPAALTLGQEPWYQSDRGQGRPQCWSGCFGDGRVSADPTTLLKMSVTVIAVVVVVVVVVVVGSGNNNSSSSSSSSSR
jgi:hypothetical protein